MYILMMMDTFGVGYALLILGLIEVGVVAWGYGAGRLLENIRTMIGWRPSIIWKIIWMVVTPTLLVFSSGFSILNYEALTYGKLYKFPHWASAIGWCLTCVSLSPIPVYLIYKLISHMRSEEGKGQSVFDALRTLSRPTNEWGPALVQYRHSETIPGDDDVFA